MRKKTWDIICKFMLRAVKILRMLRGEEMKDLWRTDEGHVEERLRTWIGEIIMSSS